MDFGAFSVSLPVKDLAVSQAFYERLGFEQAAGNAEENWVIMRQGHTTIGLFHGMFEDPILTFNPGMGQDMQPAEGHVDVRDVQALLDKAGVELEQRVEPDNTEGAGHVVFRDPDGNVIMLDQFG